MHGEGSPDASVTFRESCDVFVTFDQLAQGSYPTVPTTRPSRWSLQPADAEELILVALVRLGGARTCVTVNDLGLEVRRATPGFDPRVSRRHRLLELLDALDCIEVRPT